MVNPNRVIDHRTWHCTKAAEPFAQWCFETEEKEMASREAIEKEADLMLDTLIEAMSSFVKPGEKQIDSSNPNMYEINVGGPGLVYLPQKMMMKAKPVWHPSDEDVKNGCYPDMFDIECEVEIGEVGDIYECLFRITLSVYCDLWFGVNAAEKKQRTMAKLNGARLRKAIINFSNAIDFEDIYLLDISDNWGLVLDSFDEEGPIVPSSSKRKKGDALSKYKNNNIKELDLGDTGLKEVPESIGRFKKLKTLRLNHNQLTSLPESIGELKNLRVIWLNYNRITELPKSFANLSKLETIFLHGNCFDTIPPVLFKMTSLKSLGVGKMNISEIPRSIGNLTNLESLGLEWCQLSTLPEELFTLTNLRDLYLTDNNIKVMPDSISKLKNLEELHIKGNDIKNLSSVIKTCKIIS